MPPTDTRTNGNDGGEQPSPDQSKLRARAVARGRVEAMRRRASRIRRSVAAATIALFVAAFLGVYVQLASGHDPALDAAAKRRAATTREAGTSASGAEAEQASSGSTESSATSEPESSSGTGEEESRESSSPSSVTTRQS